MMGVHCTLYHGKATNFSIFADLGIHGQGRSPLHLSGYITIGDTGKMLQSGSREDKGDRGIVGSISILREANEIRKG